MLSLVITSFLLLRLGDSLPVDSCPSALPRDEYLQVYNGVCYQFSITRYLPFFDAVRFCTANGGIIVSIKNREVNGYLWGELRKYMVTKEVWIGLTDRNSEGEHRWMDGTKANYTNWFFNEGGQHSIIGGGEDCATMDPMVGGHWRDQECKAGFLFGSDVARPFICQYDTVANPQTTSSTTTMSSSSSTTTSSSPQTSSSTTAANTTAGSQTPSTAPTSTISTTLTSSSPSTSSQTMAVSSASSSSTATSTTTTPTTSTIPTTLTTPTTPGPLGTTSRASPVCPPFSCAIDCGITGYATDGNGCQICQCV